METYKTTQAYKENRVVKELNAAVLSGTFKDKTGAQKADLYSCISGYDVLVAHDTCPPINATLKKTIKITF